MCGFRAGALIFGIWANPNRPRIWEAQIDQLMQKQMVELNYGKRKQLYDQVQQIIAAQSSLRLPGHAQHSGGRPKESGEFQTGHSGTQHAVEC